MVSERPFKSAPVLSVEEWRAVKACSIRGVLDSELAKKFGIQEGAIRQKRFRDPEWKAAYEANPFPKGKSGPKPVTSSVTNGQKLAVSPQEAIESAISESLESIAQSNPLLLGRYVAKKIKESVTSDILPAPSTWSELQTADKILRTQTGQDREQAAVTLNLWGGAGAQIREAGGMYEVETLSQEGADFC